jgi:glycosyltransferase involved in cell wall biosynthesis
MYDASVIIPTYNRVDSLMETLESLAQQSCPSDQFEVVVIDDGSSDETPQIVNHTFPFALRYIRQVNQGGVVARNLGAKVAKGELLIFLDDDMTAEAGYLDALIEANATTERIVSRGQLLPWLPNPPSIFARIYEPSTREAQVVEDCESSPRLFASNNLAIRYDDFWRLGGWTEAVVGELGLRGGIWADLEFAYRAVQSDLQLITVAGARIYHRDYVMMSLTAASERALKISKWAVPVLQHHPALNQYLPMFVDKMPIEWKQDPPNLIVRKMMRIIASHPLVVRFLLLATRSIEHTGKSPFLLRPLYRWIIGAHHFLGYRDGLRHFRVQQSP